MVMMKVWAYLHVEQMYFLLIVVEPNKQGIQEY